MKGQEPKPSEQRTWYIARYFETEHRAVEEQLQRLGFYNVTTYRTDHWYIGDDGSPTRRKYFSAFLGGERCFVKYVENDSTIENEIFVGRYITERGIERVPRTLFAQCFSGGEKAILATSWLDDIRPFHIPADDELFRALLREYLEILNVFRENGISHNDVSESNLLIVGGRRLVLTDFGIGSVPGSERFDIDYVVHDGTYYRDEGLIRVYDDAWSFVKILDDAKISEAQKTTAEYRELLAQVGKNEHRVTLGT